MNIPPPSPMDVYDSVTDDDNAALVTKIISNNNNIENTPVVTVLIASLNEINTDNQNGTDNDSNFGNVKIPIVEWKRRIQDDSCALSKLKKDMQEK